MQKTIGRSQFQQVHENYDISGLAYGRLPIRSRTGKLYFTHIIIMDSGGKCDIPTQQNVQIKYLNTHYYKKGQNNVLFPICAKCYLNMAAFPGSSTNFITQIPDLLPSIVFYLVGLHTFI